MAYDSACGRIVLFGGDGASAFNELSDTWEYYRSGAASYTSFGAGCAEAAGIPVLAAAPGQLPWLCSTPFTLDLSPLPLGLASNGAPGCDLLVNIDVGVPLIPANGSVAWVIPSLPNAGLVGATVFAQGFVLDPLANPLGVVLSNAGELTFGVR